MNKPEKGHYRKILCSKFPEVRIAFTHSPIIGHKRVPSNAIVEALAESNDPYAQYYIDGLINGEMVTIVREENPVSKYWKPGELYFKS